MGSRNTIVDHLRAETTSEYESPALPANFCPKPSILAHFLAMKNFLGGRKPPESRRRTHKSFWPALYYFKTSHYNARMIWWAQEVFPEKVDPPPKMTIFGGGVKGFILLYSSTDFSRRSHLKSKMMDDASKKKHCLGFVTKVVNFVKIRNIESPLNL